MPNISLPPAIFALRPTQWIKNFIIFTAIIFNGKLFDPAYFLLSFLAFLVFCALSSSSYIVNDLVDLQYDKLHPMKKKRPIASGRVPVGLAVEIAFLLGLFGLIGSIFLSNMLFTVALSFISLHIFYSLFLKKHAILDIMGIAFSFILRAYAGEVITGYHLPFWLFLTILFGALFIAATKRHAELLKEGIKTRPALYAYRERLLDFYTSIFGSSSVIAYSLFTFIEEPPQFNAPLKEFLTNVLPGALERKWMIITIPFVIYGMMRYAKLAYEGREGEQPEKIVTKDIPIIIVILGWGLSIVTILYIL
jgi:decaprenyl-phosphate phosphoribosyltransferase